MTTSTMPQPIQKPVVPSLFPGKAWQQVLARDASADGQFVYAVKSTGIFCKPSCPSRRPQRKNVAFFPSPAAAESAGFRACKRCEPGLSAPRPDPQAAALATVTAYLTEHAEERTKLVDVARATGVSRLTILRGFKRALGVTPGEFARAQRVARFKDRVRLKAGEGGTAPITEAIYEAGFGSSSRLYESSASTLGMTPTELRRGAPHQTIRYAIADSPLGRMLVAATEKGICSICFADQDGSLEAELRESFPKADLVSESEAAGKSVGTEQREWLTDAVRFVLSQLTESPSAAMTFPTDTRATAFQHRVWRALQEIPRGETRSYSRVAADLGKPAATRAVAAACAANPLAVATPCHRVVGVDGRLTGYRWGVDRKRMLLKMESR